MHKTKSNFTYVQQTLNTLTRVRRQNGSRKNFIERRTVIERGDLHRFK